MCFWLNLILPFLSFFVSLEGVKKQKIHINGIQHIKQIQQTRQNMIVSNLFTYMHTLLLPDMNEGKKNNA